MLKLGIDASSYDTGQSTRWDVAAANGIRWASVRAATTGSKAQPVPDLSYVRNYEQCVKWGIQVMSYDWFDPRTDPLQQAEAFCIYAHPSSDWLMIVLEDSGSIHANLATGKAIDKWVNRVIQVTGKIPWVYTNQNYIKTYLTGYTDLCHLPLFIANYDTAAPAWALPFSPNWQAWQYTKTASGKLYGFSVPDFTVKAVSLALMQEG
jgi:GH25 family lysozyme M1 (1,4-beta-N-acetylmuramidase)